MALREGRSLDDERPERLAELEPGGRPRLPAELDDAPELADLGEERRVRLRDLRPAREMHRFGRPRARRGQEAPEVVGQEGHEGRHDAQPLGERVPERPQRRRVAVPEPPPRTADVPVRDVVHVRLVRPDDVHGHPALVRLRRLADEGARAGNEPAVERLEVARGPGGEVSPGRLPALDVRVVDEELAGVPEGEELPLDLARRPEPEEEVLVRRLRAVLPAHDVRPHAGERVLGLDHVPPRAVHLAPVLVEHLLVAEHLLERRAADEDDGHEELRVEPEPDLLAHLRDPVGGEPLLPVGVVGQVGGREALRRARRVALGHVLRALPPERRERDDPGVEPDVSDLGDALDLLAAGLAGDPDLVDPGTAELLELLEPVGRPGLELRARADHVQVPARARVEREREAVEPAARDVPVAHVPEPVVHALGHVGGRPLDGGVRLEQPGADLVDGDEPVVRDPEDERGVAAPAERVRVLVRLGADEQPAVAEVPDDLVGRLAGGDPVQPAVLLGEAPRLVHGRQHGETMHAGEVEVLGPAARGDVHDAGPRGEVHLLPGDDAVLDLAPGRERVERPPVAEPHELLSPRAPRERLVGEERDCDPVAVLEQPVLRLRLDRSRDVRGKRPRRRRPDDERFVLPLDEREPHVERGVDPVLVVAGELVRRDRGSAAGAPLRRAMAEDEPAALVDDLQELPDVLDVRVREREVVLAPVHPLAEADGALRQLLGRPGDDLAAAPGELREAVLLDLPLRVQPELALDPDLDPETLAVEPVLVALVESPESLVALEDVLERAAPRRMDGERLVRRDRTVDEAEPRAAAVLLTEPLERTLALPELEDLALEGVVVRLVGKR